MRKSIKLFRSIMSDTRNAEALFNYLETVVRPPYDFSDLLRWQWAQAVSALDKLVHDLVRVGMMEIFQGIRTPTQKYQTFLVDMSVHEEMVRNPHMANSLFEQKVIQKHSFLSFQDPDKIADALSNIWTEPHKWMKIANELGLEERFTKTKLKNISIRRNQVVHEGDYSSSLLQRQPIAKDDVRDVLDFVENLGEAIYNLVKL